ncbi:hypothetical protein QVA66_06920 [Staphylococcus chromogenes]|nr:hypothetical protein [Staphylococcus chromogenes]
MPAPRLNIGLIGAEDFGLSERLAKVGHVVTPNVPWDGIGAYECVLLALAEDDLHDAIPRLVPHASPRQIFFHTCLAEGVDVLTELQAVSIALHPQGQLCVVGSEDELSETIAVMLVHEMDLEPVTVPEAERKELIDALAAIDRTRAQQRSILASMRSGGAARLVQQAIQNPLV